MANSNNKGSQSRFLLAAVLSMVVLLGWSYFYTPRKPPADETNIASNANSAPAPTVQATPSAQLAQALPVVPVASTPDTTPSRTFTIRSPLYEVTFDSNGALATSWIILKNKSPKEERPVYADGSTTGEKKPLQLISQEALSRNPRDIPFRLSTDDQNLNALINSRNYQISETGDTIELSDGQQKQIDFTLTDARGVRVTKSFVFRADDYVADLSIKLTNNGQPVPNTKLLIGASLGDQAIVHHSFYHIEPEAIAYINDSVYRRQGAGFTFDPNNQATLAVPGNIDWAGVGDAYFAMAAIPAQQTQGLEYRADKYEFPTEPYHDGIISWLTGTVKTSETRHLITAYVPITTDGKATKILTAPKDYFALGGYGSELPNPVGRTIQLTNLINFSNYSCIRPVTKQLAIPILYALNFFNSITYNYGIAIIVFTLLFYSLLFPLRWYQSRSFKKASGNAPKMKEMQEKIKD